jgi:hypothetical protein
VALRRDIPEGALLEEMPRWVGWGRVLSGPRLRETYVTFAILGARLFVARGCFGKDKNRSFRWWFQYAR